MTIKNELEMKSTGIAEEIIPYFPVCHLERSLGEKGKAVHRQKGNFTGL